MNKKQTIQPEVGLYANFYGWSDVEPYEITKVSKTGSVITIRKMKAERDPTWKPEIVLGGFARTVVNQNEQRWTIEPDESGTILRAHRRKTGYYHSGRGKHIVCEQPRKFYDYNF